MVVEVAERLDVLAAPKAGHLWWRWIALAAIGALVFIGSWTILTNVSPRHQLRDTPLYEAYGDALRVGDIPYRNYLIEYPPAALASFVVPALTTAPEHFSAYSKSFEHWMAASGLVMLLCTLAALISLEASFARAGMALHLVALSPLLLGPLVLSRFDIWPATLSIAAVATLLAGRHRWSMALLGIAVMAKLYAIVCVPLFLIYIARRTGRRNAAIAAAIHGATAATILGPFAFLAPAGVAHIFTFQLGRPLQIESLGAVLLVAAHHVFSLPLSPHDDHGSRNLLGALPKVIGDISVAAQVALIALTQVRFARGPATPQRLVIAVAAAVTTFIAFGKVFSPQYMIWLIPLVPLIGGRRGIAASALLSLALVLTHAWFPANYGAYAIGLRPLQTLEVLTRDIVLVTLAVTLVAWLRKPSGDQSKPAAEDQAVSPHTVLVPSGRR
jgi:hypothetical protein